MIFFAVFAMATAGCDEAELNEVSERREPTVQAHSYDSLVQLKLAAVTPNGPVEVQTAEQFKRVLGRYSEQPVVRNQVTTETETAYQQINPNGGNSFFMGTAEKPPNVPHIMYNSRSQNLGGVMLNLNDRSWLTFFDDAPYTGHTTWWYGQIDGDQSAGNIGVEMSNPSGGGTSIISGGTGIIQVDMDYTLEFTETEVTYDIVARIGSQEVFSVSGLTMPRSAENIALIPFAPMFASPTSGTFAIERDYTDPYIPGDDGPNAGLTYWIQRGLALEQPLQDFTLNPGEPAVFSNSFAWDFGDNRTSLQDASWDIKITAPGGQPVTTLSGTGRNITGTWDTTGITEPFRLKPKGQDAADGGTPIYAYEIVIRAVAYDNASPDHGALDATGDGPLAPIPFEDVFYEVSTAKVTAELKILNIKLEPNPPFQTEGQPVQLTADIVAVGLPDLDEDDVEWWVELIGPDGDPVGDPLATDNGFEVRATWDGKIDSVPVDDPMAYSLRIRANACSINPRRAKIRAQAACPPGPKVDVPLSGPRMTVTGIVLEDTPVGVAETEKRVGVGFSPSVLGDSGSPSLQQMRRDLLGRVQTLKESPAGGYDVDLEVQVEFPDNVTPPDQLMLQARNMITGETLDDIEAVAKSIDEGGLIYTVTATNLPSAFINNDSPGGTTARTRYSIGEFYRDKAKPGPTAPNGQPTVVLGRLGVPPVSKGSTEAFMHLVENSPTVFPQPLFLGRFAETAIAADVLSDHYPTKAAGTKDPLPETLPPLKSLADPPFNDPAEEALRLVTTVTSQPENLATTGFVPVEFTVSRAAANKDPAPLTPVYVKVPRVPEPAVNPGQAPRPSLLGPNVALWTYHGDDHEGGTLHPSSDYDRSVLPPQKRLWDIGPSTPRIAEKLGQLKTLIMTGCSILDINDYNNGFAVIHDPNPSIPGDETWDLVNQRNHGGEKWDAVMGTASKDGAVILGYNDVAPLLGNGAENRVAELMELFEAELARLSSVPLAERRQWAWMSANVQLAARAGTNQFDFRWAGLHATAIDRDYYYYIPQNKNRAVSIPVDPSNQKGGFVTYETYFPSVLRDKPVWRVARNPKRPLNPPPPGSPPAPAGARPEWGVYYPGQVDLRRYDYNRDHFAEWVDIPGLNYPPGGL